MHFSLHEPMAFGSAKCWLENVHTDVETNETRVHRGADHSDTDFELCCKMIGL
jgi:hypothetical protein